MHKIFTYDFHKLPIYFNCKNKKAFQVKANCSVFKVNKFEQVWAFPCLLGAGRAGGARGSQVNFLEGLCLVIW